MRLFHISDVLSVTTGLLVSTRHMDGVYDILNFLTGDSLFTHQLPRATRECEPWLRTQFAQLFPEDPTMAGLLSELTSNLEAATTKAAKEQTVARWLEAVRTVLAIPEQLPVYEMGADMHVRIDPIEEARAMIGDKNVFVVSDEAAR